MAEHDADTHTELNQTEARQGFRGRHALTVLIASLVIAVVAWVILEYAVR
jgi:hypothetical protein